MKEDTGSQRREERKKGSKRGGEPTRGNKESRLNWQSGLALQIVIDIAIFAFFVHSYDTLVIFKSVFKEHGKRILESSKLKMEQSSKYLVSFTCKQ